MNVFAHLLWAVANSVWQSAAIAGLAWFALRLARRTSAALRYSVWSGVLLAAACLPAINYLMPAPVVSVHIAEPVAFRLTTTPIDAAAVTTHAATTHATTHAAATTHVANHAAATTHVANHAVNHADVVGRAQLGENLAASTLAATSASASGPVRFKLSAVEVPQTPMQRFAAWSRSTAAAVEFWTNDRSSIAFWIWAGITTLLLVRLGIGFTRLRRIKTGLVRLDDADIVATCNTASRPVTVGASVDVECPCVIGYARPVVALPAMLVEELDRSDLRRVLAHELGHIRRWDDWANLFQQFVRAVCFYNPIVHVACRALDVDREIACDDLVAAGHSDRLEYAKCLTEIARRTTFAEHLVPAAGFFPDRRQIVVRIEQLLDRDHLGSARVGVVPIASAAFLVVAVLALAKHQVPAFAMTPPVAPVPPFPMVAPAPVQPLPSVALPAKTAVTHKAPVAAIALTVKPGPATAPKSKLAIATAIDMQSMPMIVARHASLRQLISSQKLLVLTPANAPLARSGRPALGSVTPAAAPLSVSGRLVIGSASPVAAGAVASSNAGDFLDALAAAGYTHLSVDELISVRNAGVTPSYLRSLKQYGITPMPVSKLIALANAGVDADFIAAMHAAGYDTISADDLVSLRNSGVTSRFVQAMAASGHARPTTRELIELANSGVSPQYVQNLSKNGYAGLSVDSLISLANAGVSSDYVIGMVKQGYAKMSVDTLVSLANAGVSPSYVKSLADVGYSKISTDDLIRLVNAGVTAKLIKTLHSHGIGDKGQLSVDELIQLSNAGF